MERLSKKVVVPNEDKQRGINMVDLMMWLVIAALILAAALQSIGYYQKSSYVYQMSEDVGSIATTATAIAASKGRVINSSDIEEAIANTKRLPDVSVTWGTVSETEAAQANGDFGFELASTTTPVASVPATPPSGYVYALKATHTGVQEREIIYLFEEAGTYDTGTTVVNKGEVAFTPAPESSGNNGGSDSSAATTLTASRTIGQKVTLSWGSVAGASGYVITAGDSTFTVSGGATTSTTITLPTGFTGSATIKSVTNGVSSSPSAPVDIKVADSDITVAGGSEWLFDKTEITGSTNSINDLVSTTRQSSMVSQNGQYLVTFRTDGDFVIYDTISGKATMSTQTAAPNRKALTMIFQGDGNLVAYDDRQEEGNPYAPAVKAAGSWGIPMPAKMTLENDGSLKIRDANGEVRYDSSVLNGFLIAVS